jgi:hypothetical protein
MIREDIYAAVFAFFAGLTTDDERAFKTATRKVTTWDCVAPEDQPALLMTQESEEATRVRGLPTKWVLHIKLWLYVHTGANNDPDVVPSQVLNPLIDAVEASLVVDDLSNNACTLGGLVSHCAIEGPIQIFQGDLGDQEVAIIPLVVVVPT